MTQEPTAEDFEREKEAYFDPDASTIQDWTTIRMLQLGDEIRHLRAAGQHWKGRALAAEKRAEDLQRKLNAKLADESAAAIVANGKAESAAEGVRP